MVVWASDAGVVAVSGVVLAGVAVVWVLGTALDVVSREVVAGTATVVSSDVAAVVWLLGGSSGGWGVCRDVVSRLGGVYRRF